MKTKKLLKKMFKLLKKIDKNTERFEHSDGETAALQRSILKAAESPLLLKKLVENKDNRRVMLRRPRRLTPVFDGIDTNPEPEGAIIKFRRPTPFYGLTVEPAQSTGPISGLESVDENDDVRPE